MHRVPSHTLISGMPRKQIWFASFFVLVSAGFFFFLFSVLQGGGASAQTFFLLALTLITWVVVFALSTMLLDKKGAYYAYAPMLLIALLLLGTKGFGVIGVFLFGAGVAIAYHKAQREKKLLIEFKPFRIARRSLPIFFTGLSLLLAVSYHSFILQDTLEELHVSPELFELMYAPTDLMLGLIIPDYNTDASISEVQASIIQNILPKLFPPGLDPTAPERFFQPQLLDPEISSQTLKEFTFQWLNTNLATIVEPFRALLPAFFIVGIFFTFKFLFIFVLWATVVLAWLVIKILLFYNIIVLTERDVKKKDIVFE